MQDFSLNLLLADLVLASHVAVVVFIVSGLILTLLGGFANWKWVRNPWYRLLHLLCVVVVVLQAWAGFVCPLTTLEMWLRAKADAEIYSGSFITYWLQSVLYYQAPQWVFTVVYSVFGGLVLASWVWVRPTSGKTLLR